MRINLLCTLMFFSGCIATQSFNGSRKLGRELTRSEIFPAHFTGLIVKNLNQNKILFSYHAKKLFTPASNTKLFTFRLADKLLPDSLPSIKFCVQDDTLHFSGMADPTLLHPDFAYQPSVELLRKSDYPIAYYPAQYESERFGSGWAWDDFPHYFQPEKSALPLYGNCLWVMKDSTDINIGIIPKYWRCLVSIEQSHDTGFKISREESNNHFTIRYDTLPGEIDRCIPFRSSDTLMIEMLSDTLHKNIYLNQKSDVCHDAGILYSSPADSVYRKLLVDSDNFLAEQLLLSISALLFDTLSTEKSIHHALANEIIPIQDSLQWVDGSGLSRYNAMSPASILALLEEIYHNAPWNRIKALFPAGGQQGTLKNFLPSDKPFVYAKSGSMTGVYNLSGYLVTDKGHILAFSFMNNHIKHSFKELKAEMEKVLITLKEYY